MARLGKIVSLTLDCPKLRTLNVCDLWELKSCVLVSSAISHLIVDKCPYLDASSMILPTLESIDLMETFVSNTETDFRFYSFERFIFQKNVFVSLSSTT